MRSSPEQDTAFARAYRMIRQRSFVPGQRIRVDELARHVGLSATPVREILSRLVGEALVEERRGEGYFAPRPGAGEIVELYAWLEAVVLALLDTVAARAAVTQAQAQVHCSLSECLQHIAALRRGSLLARELGRVDARMEPLRAAEALHMATLPELVGTLAAAIAAADLAGQRRALRAYCRDGQALAHRLADEIARNIDRI